MGYSEINIYAIRKPKFEKNSNSSYRIECLPMDFINLAWSSEVTNEVIKALNKYSHIIQTKYIFPLYQQLEFDELTKKKMQNLKETIPSTRTCLLFMKTTNLENYNENSIEVNNALKELCSLWKSNYVVIGEFVSLRNKSLNHSEQIHYQSI